MALTVPNGPATKTIEYSDLRGVDFSQDASLVDRHHSPDMLNMISDDGGSPIKRKGWEILYDLSELYAGANIRGLWRFKHNGKTYFPAYYVTDTRSGVTYFDPETRSFHYGYSVLSPNSEHFVSFFMNETFYLSIKLGSGDPGFVRFFIYENIPRVEQVVPKIPVTIINRDPATGGGTTYYDFNLLTPARTEMFTATTSTTSYLLSATTTDPDETVPEGPGSMKFEYLKNTGEWIEDDQVTVTRVQTGNTYTFKVNSSAKADMMTATPDNVRISYVFGENKSAKILSCTNSGFYSHGGLDQVFVTGNQSYPNYVWYSDYGDPTYFPDLNYIVAGNADSKCMGFLNVGENLAVVKETSYQDPSLFFIYETSITSKTVTTNTGSGSESETTQEYAYAIKRASAGIGAISNNCFNTLIDEPLFLSENGVQGIVSTNTTSEKVIRNRSRNVDKKLLAEPNLDKARACVYNGYYYIFINGHVYVFDSRHTTSDRRGNTSYMYEAYYWDNVPASCICATDSTIYFGTSDGKVCRFKNTGLMTDYSDGSHYDEDEDEQVGGTAIHARWATRNDDDDAPQYFKTMMKKGTMCTVAPFEKSSVMVFIQADARPSQDDILAGQQDVGRYYVGEYYLNAGNLFPGPIDFSRLLFDARQGPRDYFFRKKKKKYIRLQIILENATINEGFGVFHVVKTFSPTRYAK